MAKKNEEKAEKGDSVKEEKAEKAPEAKGPKKPGGAGKGGKSGYDAAPSPQPTTTIPGGPPSQAKNARGRMRGRPGFGGPRPQPVAPPSGGNEAPPRPIDPVPGPSGQPVSIGIGGGMSIPGGPPSGQIPVPIDTPPALGPPPTTGTAPSDNVPRMPPGRILPPQPGPSGAPGGGGWNAAIGGLVGAQPNPDQPTPTPVDPLSRMYGKPPDKMAPTGYDGEKMHISESHGGKSKKFSHE